MLRHRNEYPVEATVRASDFDGATTWIHSPPLTAEGLRGRVVLASFGTYTCINWIRSSPYVRAWADKYADKGLVVVGINTPEFEFEGNLDNVERALKEMTSATPSRSTTTTPSGRRSTTTTGRPCTSSTP